jgi:hypothetical protein
VNDDCVRTVFAYVNDDNRTICGSNLKSGKWDRFKKVGESIDNTNLLHHSIPLVRQLALLSDLGVICFRCLRQRKSGLVRNNTISCNNLRIVSWICHCDGGGFSAESARNSRRRLMVSNSAANCSLTYRSSSIGCRSIRTSVHKRVLPCSKKSTAVLNCSNLYHTGSCIKRSDRGISTEILNNFSRSTLGIATT